MNPKTIFEEITNLEVLSYTFIKSGYTNNNYLISTNEGNYVCRIPTIHSNQIINRNEEYEVYQKIKDYSIDVETIYFNQKTGIKITKYLNDCQPFNNKAYTSKQLELIAGKIRSLHQLKLKVNHNFDPLKKFRHYQSLIKTPLFNYPLIDELLECIDNHQKNNPMILCHNDLVENNILFHDHDVLLIDYEYAGNNVVEFDLISFLGENNIKPSDQEVFLKAYYLDRYDTIDHLFLAKMMLFQDLLWSYWANYYYEQTNEQLYLDILNDKLQNIKNNLHPIEIRGELR